MPVIFARRPSPAIVVAVGAVVLASAGVVGAHGGDAGMVHACVDPNGGLHVAGSPSAPEPGAECPPGWRALDWNTKGPQGATGPPGPTGLQGPAGPQGPPGAQSPASTDVVRVITKRSKFNTRNDKVVVARCPGASTLVSGGYEMDGDGSRRDAVISRPARANGAQPSDEAPPEAWMAKTSNDRPLGVYESAPDDHRFRLIAYAVCEGPAEAFDTRIAPPVRRPR